MAILVADVAMNLGGTKTLHPFFSKPQNSDCQAQPNPGPSHDRTPKIEDISRESELEQDEAPSEKSKGARTRPLKRKSTIIADSSGKSQAILEGFAKRSATEKPAETQQQTAQHGPQRFSAETDPVEDASSRRSKRRRISLENEQQKVPDSRRDVSSSPELEQPNHFEPDTPTWREQLQAAAEGTTAQTLVHASSPRPVADAIPTTSEAIPSTPPSQMNSSPPSTRRRSKRNSPKAASDVLFPPGDTQNALPQASEPAKINTTPKKMLKLNASGKFSSPVSKSKAPKQEQREGGGTPKQHKRRSAAASHRTPLVLKFGHGDKEKISRIGNIIEGIMSGKIRHGGKAAQLGPQGVSITCGKPTGPQKPTHPFFRGKQALKDAAKAPKDSTVESSPSAIPSPRKSAVTPGKLRNEARRDMPEIKFAGFGSTLQRPNTVKHLGAVHSPWPWKGVVHTRDLQDLSGSLNDAVEQTMSVRHMIPRRAKGNATFVSDEENMISTIADAVSSLPATKIYADNEFPPPADSIRVPERLVINGSQLLEMARNQMPEMLREPHPAISRLLENFEDSLTAFDRGTCENDAWASKYAPKTALEVLQSTQSMDQLRSWLTSLMVQSVTMKESGEVGSKRAKTQRPPKKRRKKTSELDDFIVESDDDEDNASLKKSNLILISGPHGCGKTAAVHAIAKEMNFDIFEINSGSRRSGKDITDKVGDMTENHLVSNRQEQPLAPILVDSDTERAAEAFQKDITSGRQGMMTSFFQKQSGAAKAKSKTKATKEADGRPKPTNVIQHMNTKLRQRKSQQQSLILLEEVDILFEDDKGFWSTVIELAAQSKRPIILTCNDEKLLPMEELEFQAILRFSPPAEDLASAYLLLIAAREGHVIDRHALTSLYQSKNADLRASITELNFWCQMAVGSRRGGLEWIYQRWPPGKDVDLEGKTLRVASRDTYLNGMGWTSHDIANSTSLTGLDRAEELNLQLWNDWSIDPTETSIRLSDAVSSRSENAMSTLEGLRDWERQMEDRSSADVFCRIGLPSARPGIADTTQPRISEKARLSYTSGMPLLQADELYDYQNIDTQIASNIAAAPRRIPNSSVTETSASLGDSCILTILAKKREDVQAASYLPHDIITTLEPITYPHPDRPIQTNPPVSCIHDRSFHIISTDIAPYIRSIAASDRKLEEQRLRLGNLLSEGGRGVKRQRTTRASRSALEGGRRETTRRERWFNKELNLHDVLKTASESWAAMGTILGKDEDESDAGSTANGSQRVSEGAISPEA